MKSRKMHYDLIRNRGADDFKAGKPISAFFDMRLEHHTELERGSYEMGWRGAKAEARDEARKSTG